MAERNRFFEDERLDERFKGRMVFRILRYVKPYRKTIAFIFALMLAMGFVALLPPMFNRIIIDGVFAKQPAYVRLAVGIMLAWASVAAADVTYTFFRSRIMAKTGYKIVRDIRRDVFYNLQKLAFDYYDSRPAGKILVRVTNYVDDLANIFSSVIIGMVVDIIKMLLVTVWLVILDPRLALVTLGAMIPLCAAFFSIYHFLHKRSGDYRNKVSNRTAYIAENINGSFVTKAFGRAQTNTEIYDGLNKECNRRWRRFIRLNETLWPTMDFFYSAAVVGTYLLVLYLALGDEATRNGMSIGLLSGFIGYMGMYVGPLNNIASQFQSLSLASSNAERIFEVMSTEPSVFDKPDAYRLPPITGAVEFEDVTFAYEKGRPVLENLTLSVPAGKCVALVGPTGAGKSTVVNLLSRFYDATGGRVLVDGHDVAGVTLQSLREQVGVMMQDTFIFGGTVMENIRFGRPSASDAECVEAAKTVSASDFIEKFSDKYAHVLAEQGAGLSVGEKQLLCFARAVVADPKILILDEATSSVDSETEAKIQSALNALLKGRTSFVIAHRLSTIKRADCILFIANKNIAEAGTHEQLMEKHGLYYELATTA
ncbi:MAG: ABC transporter ATP-binding protein/permease [Clostridiales bacterium]|jgi:ATP-binding cassette subfamily B protein|nr:ABC transporter ATP-binding protein/permease [Clostridiales bacterium]